MTSEICAMTSQPKTAVAANRPFSMPVAFSLPVLRPLSLLPLHEGPVKATTPEGMRSLHPVSTLSVINEHEGTDDEPSPLDKHPNRTDTDLSHLECDKSERLTLTNPNPSTLSGTFNNTPGNHGNQTFNNYKTSQHDDDNDNNNDKDNNDKSGIIIRTIFTKNNLATKHNNDKDNNGINTPCQIITTDYDEEISAKFHLAGETDNRHIEFLNKSSGSLVAASPDEDCFPALYRLGSVVDIDFEDSSVSPGLEGVKAMANRLKLSTRRPSYQQWRDRYIGTSGVPRFPVLNQEDQVDERLTEERKNRINSAIEWIKNELGQMRTADHNLATQLLTLRHDIHRLKLERSCENHQDLLDDVKDELSERETWSAVCDIPYDMEDNNPLKHLGVTRMNICSRRFSMC